MELFENASSQNLPLAARLRPTSLDKYIGQKHILGEGRLLRRLIQADRLSSLIFYGPPGTGKTTLASVIANTTKSRFVILNAVLSGVKELRVSIDEAKEALALYGKKTILFVDEVHRWNKSQQDALLPWVENGTVILIGATTENPFFEVNKALVSRSRIFQLTPLTDSEMEQVLKLALTDIPFGYGSLKIKIEDEAKSHLIKSANGDARNLLNALELAVETSKDGDKEISIDLNVACESIQQKAVLYDKEGDYHYDVISAFIKSVRGSDVDAALYWLAKMVAAGENPRFIFRRLLILACEDVGLADPSAISIVESAARAFDRVGLPEGNYMLAHATLYLATAKKSNSSMGFFDALAFVQNQKDQNVPTHLKDPSRDAKGFGDGKGYLYPHAYKEHWVSQDYLPASLKGKIFYHPSEIGYEATIKDEVLKRRELALELVFNRDEQEHAYLEENKKFNLWQERSEKDLAEAVRLRDEIVKLSKIRANSRVLVLEENSALLYWEALRVAKAGGTYLLSENKTVIDHINHHFEEYNIEDIPLIIEGSRLNRSRLNQFTAQNNELRFDKIVGRSILNGFKTFDEVEAFFCDLNLLLDREGTFCFSLYNYALSTTLPSLLLSRDNEKLLLPSLLDKIRSGYNQFCEKQFCHGENGKQLTSLLEKIFVKVCTLHQSTYKKSVVLDEKLIDKLLAKKSFSLPFLFEQSQQQEMTTIFKRNFLGREIPISHVDNIYLLCNNK